VERGVLDDGELALPAGRGETLLHCLPQPVVGRPVGVGELGERERLADALA
jgi:hypothetical protein